MAKLGRRWTLFARAYLWRRILFRTRFIAITGSVGKTTTKDLTAAILGLSAGATLANFGSENTTREVAQTVLRVRPWHRFAVLEVATARPGQIATSARIVAPDIAVVLSVARTHTNNFATLEDTAAEKAVLLKFLRRRGEAILNLDDPCVAAMQARPGARVIRFGRDDRAQVRASDVGGHWPEKLSFVVNCESGAARVESQLVGTHWTPAILAAIALGLQCGVPLKQIAAQIARVPPTAGRMEPCTLPNGAVILRDEFNAALDTYHAAFAELKAARAARKILLISTVSDSPENWDKRLRRIAVDAARVVDLLVLIGARDDSKRAAKAAQAAGLPPERVRRFGQLREAAEYLRGELRAGDLMLLRGKAEHHLTRLFYAQLREIACWEDTCPKRMLCDHCPDLFADGALVKVR